MCLHARAEDCNLDDGDISRLLSRTTDLLRQVCPRRSPLLLVADALCSRSPVPESERSTCTACRRCKGLSTTVLWARVQVVHVPQLLPALRTAARNAFKRMDRPPISDLLR